LLFAFNINSAKTFPKTFPVVNVIREGRANFSFDDQFVFHEHTVPDFLRSSSAFFSRKHHQEGNGQENHEENHVSGSYSLRSPRFYPNRLDKSNTCFPELKMGK
jgi:hypothetical protein